MLLDNIASQNSTDHITRNNSQIISLAIIARTAKDNNRQTIPLLLQKYSPLIQDTILSVQVFSALLSSMRTFTPPGLPLSVHQLHHWLVEPDNLITSGCPRILQLFLIFQQNS